VSSGDGKRNQWRAMTTRAGGDERNGGERAVASDGFVSGDDF